MLAPDGEVAPPAEDEFLLDGLVGCTVTTRDGRPVGRVRDVLESGGAALLVVDAGPGRDDVFVPFSRTICVGIDPAGKAIVIDPPDGLLELNEI
jgi:16S rRNA processing protein RimM